jgi:hypothetical protein
VSFKLQKWTKLGRFKVEKGFKKEKKKKEQRLWEVTFHSPYAFASPVVIRHMN